MYLKNDKIVVTIKDDLVMRSYNLSTMDRYVLDPTAILGWTDGTSARRDATSRANSNGDFTEKATLSSRIISLSGTAIASSRQGLQTMRDNLIGALSNGDYALLQVETSLGSRYATVGLEGIPSWTQKTDNVAVWKLDLYAPDPYIYGVEKIRQTGAYSTIGGLKYVLKYPLNYNISGENTIQTITNSGNVPAYPKFKVTGDFYSGFSISDNLGSVVTYSGMVTISAPVTIDMATGTATQNGVDKTTLINKRDWFAIPAGQTIQPTFTPTQNGSGWCDIIYRDTWI